MRVLLMLGREGRLLLLLRGVVGRRGRGVEGGWVHLQRRKEGGLAKGKGTLDRQRGEKARWFRKDGGGWEKEGGREGWTDDFGWMARRE